MNVVMQAQEHRIEEVEVRIRAAFEAGEFECAATAAIEGYGPELFGFLANLLQDAEGASEAFSQACEDLWAGIRGFQWRCQFRTWAFAVTRRAYQRYLGRERRWKYRRLSSVSEPQVLAARVRTATSPYLRTEVKTRMVELRAQLPVPEQTLLILRVDRNLAWKDVARVMAGLEEDLDEQTLVRTAANCRKQFERAKERLRRLATEEGLLDG